MPDNLPIAAVLVLILSFVYINRVRLNRPPSTANAPIAVPYLIPWIGSFFSFNKDPLGFLEKCHLLYGASYKFSVAGRIFVVITDPEGLASIARDTTNHLDHKAAFTHMLRAVSGLGPESVDFILDLLDTKIFPVVKTLLYPASMPALTERIDLLLPRELEALHVGDAPSVSLNLSELVRRPIYNAGCRVLFGPTFSLDSFEDFVALDAHLPQLLTRLPFIAQRGKNARLRMVLMLEKYIDAWWNSNGKEEIPEVSVTVMQFLTELKAAQVSKHDAACTLLLFLWGFQANMWFMISWMLTHVVIDKTSMTSMVAEIDTFKAKHSLDQLDNPEYGPRILESAMQETFRWATTATTARLATEDTFLLVAGVQVPIMKGEWILGDVRAVHHNPKVYEDPHAYQIDRYVNRSSDASPVPKPFPWGQGKHMCPGRHVAMHITRRFVVELLSIYEVIPAKRASGNTNVPAISTHHFLGSLKSTEEVPVTLIRRVQK